ncbi:3-oxo-5-alpha-steroid 4-dehydrogenase 2a [Aplochiton taeniatus]
MEYAVLECNDNVIRYLSWGFIIGAVAYFFRQTKTQTPYGRYVDTKAPLGVTCPAKLAWLLQESPSFLVPVLLLLTTNAQSSLGKQLLLWTFCMHYFQRTFIYSLMTKGRSSPLYIVISAIIFCSCNGFLQGHYLLHCATYDGTWLTNIRLAIGLILFFIGMAINIHSDHILRCLRKPGEIVYRIPKGGMFEYVSGANFFGEILEWCGYAIATWSLPTFSFAFFTMCSIGPRAYHHHRFYRERFDDYPKFRKAVIPYIL